MSTLGLSGFSMKLSAPFSIASTATLMLPWPLTTMTCDSGLMTRSSRSRSSPSTSGSIKSMRMMSGFHASTSWRVCCAVPAVFTA